MKEICPECGALLEIVECCGGGLWKCENCGEFFYPGELMGGEEDSPHRDREKGGD